MTQEENATVKKRRHQQLGEEERSTADNDEREGNAINEVGGRHDSS